MDSLIKCINPVKIYVLLTFIMAWTLLDRKKRIHWYLLMVLTICLMNELANSILIYIGRPYAFVTTIGSTLHHILWLVCLVSVSKERKKLIVFPLLFLLFAAINISFFEGFSQFNCYTFVCGAMLYVILFIYVSFSRMRKEDFAFFYASNYLLLLAPLLLFIGPSLMFGFKDNAIAKTTIHGIKLYTIILLFVNIINYTLINIYILQERKSHA